MPIRYRVKPEDVVSSDFPRVVWTCGRIRVVETADVQGDYGYIDGTVEYNSGKNSMGQDTWIRVDSGDESTVSDVLYDLSRKIMVDSSLISKVV